MSVVVDVDVEESHATIKSGLNGAEMGTDGDEKSKKRRRQSKKSKRVKLQREEGGERNGDAGSYLYTTKAGTKETSGAAD